MKQLCAAILAFGLFSTTLHAQEAEKIDAFIDSIYPATITYGYARAISNTCGSIRMKRGVKARMERWIYKKQREAGISERDAVTALYSLSERLIKDQGAFLEKHGAVEGGIKTYCAAGERVIANNHPVATYLVKRR